MPARREVREAAIYLNNRRFGLGKELLDEVRVAIADVVASPGSNPVVIPGVRKRNLRRFSYRLLYTVEADHIEFVAFMHLHQRPGYWRDRLT